MQDLDFYTLLTKYMTFIRGASNIFIHFFQHLFFALFFPISLLNFKKVERYQKKIVIYEKSFINYNLYIMCSWRCSN